MQFGCGKPHVAYVYIVVFLTMTGLSLTLSISPNVTTGLFNGGDQCLGDDAKTEQCKHVTGIVAVVKSVTMAIGAIVSFFVNPVMGRMSDNLGRRPMLIFTAVCAFLPAAAYMLFQFAGVTLWLQIAVSCISSFTSSPSVGLAYVADLVETKDRAIAFGGLMGCTSVALIVGALASTAMDQPTTFVTYFVVMLAVLLYSVFVIPESLPEDKRQRNLEAERQALAKAAADSAAQGDGRGNGNGHDNGDGQPRAERSGAMLAGFANPLIPLRILWRSPLFRRLGLTAFCSACSLWGVFDVLYLYLKDEFSFSANDNAYLLVCFGVTGLIVQGLLLRLLMRCLNEKQVYVIGLAFSVCVPIFYAVMWVKWLAYPSTALLSVGMLTFPALSALKSNNTHESEQGTIQGALYGINAFGQAVGPLVCGGLFSAFTSSGMPYVPAAPFYFACALSMVGLIIGMTIPHGQGPPLRPIGEDFASDTPATVTSDATAVNNVVGGVDSPQAAVEADAPLLSGANSGRGPSDAFASFVPPPATAVGAQAAASGHGSNVVVVVSNDS